MTARITTRYRLSHSSESVLEALTDPDFHDARVCHVGGPGSSLLDFEHDPSTRRLTLGTRQQIERADLPDIVRRHTAGTLYADRFERWELSPTWSAGEFDVDVPDAPLRSGGRMSLLDDGDACILAIRLSLSVSVPLLGRTIERRMSATVRDWLEDEADFTRQWLAGRGLDAALK